MSDQIQAAGEPGTAASIALLQRIATDAAEMKHFIPAAQSPDALAAYLAGKGIEVSLQDAEALRELLAAELVRQDETGGATRLEDAELDAVAGGIGMGSGAIQNSSAEKWGKALLSLAGFLVSTVQSGGPLGAILTSALTDDITRIAKS